MDLITTLTADLTAWVVDAAGAPWVYLLVFICCTVDGFFPPFPSESVVVGLASLIVTQGTPNPWLLMLAAALGAFIGDNTAYAIGRGIGLTRFRWMRRPRARRSFAWASSELDKRAASLLLVGRFLPIGRVAVNLAAGPPAIPGAASSPFPHSPEAPGVPTRSGSGRWPAPGSPATSSWASPSPSVSRC
jgi:membrane protein DedA with SNARE-associated domain